ncbi:HAMP domain-containing protein [Bacillus aerolatus]|uniref:histidine kinase n=1 Tax=Bacillus aerolatus TaxID=2653354 RepID=A0A6I1FR67_9BACI|nr:HAMP domain-containing protein [Bacillus aerolatus]
MNKITLKLGLWFFFVMMMIEVCLFFVLHTGLVESRVEEELSALLARGNSHREVLEDLYNTETLHHIALMELKADTEVIITDGKQNIIISSSKVDNGEKKIVSKKLENVPRDGKILERRWKNEKYISTVSPYSVNGHQNGYVYMFKSTDQVQRLISKLNQHFLLAAAVTIILLIVTILFLSRALTTPLIQMKRATEKLSKGNFSVQLPDRGEDELGELSRSITILAQDLKHLKEQRNDFLSSISHELRTPLTYIKGYADVARRRNIADKDRERYLDIIYEESEKLSNMMKDLFDLAKMDQNTFVIHQEKVQICFYLRGICEKMMPAFKEKDINLEINCNENMYVLIDPMRFEQVFLNLFDNAIKYSDPHTKTSVLVKREKENVLIEVKDEGRGIPGEDIPFIFERLYRVDKSRSRDFGGTGLGLSIAKELVEAHQGRIEVKSGLGKGSTFLILIEEMTE